MTALDATKSELSVLFRLPHTKTQTKHYYLSTISIINQKPLQMVQPSFLNPNSNIVCIFSINDQAHNLSYNIKYGESGIIHTERNSS